MHDSFMGMSNSLLGKIKDYIAKKGGKKSSISLSQNSTKLVKEHKALKQKAISDLSLLSKCQ